MVGVDKYSMDSYVIRNSGIGVYLEERTWLSECMPGSINKTDYNLVVVNKQS